MSEGNKHWVDTLSDIESQEEARIHLVASASSNIFNLLFDLIQEAVTLYHKRHPMQFGAGPVIINRASDGASLSLFEKGMITAEEFATLKAGIIKPATSGKIALVKAS